MVTEEALGSHDVSRVAQLHGDEPVTVHLLVPADTKHNSLIEALDEVALGRLRDALDDSEDATPAQAEQDAMHAVNASIEAALPAANPDGDLLGRDLSELRLVKDAWEVAEVQAAVDATARG